MRDHMPMCNAIASNPDVAGIGARSACYLQALLCFLMALKFPDARARAYRRTLQYTNCSIILSALVQDQSQHGLSVLDTVLVSMMSVMLLSCIFGFLSSHIEHTNRLDALSYALSLACTWAWGLFIWTRIHGCYSNEVVVILGQSISFNNLNLQRRALALFGGIGGYTIFVVRIKRIDRSEQILFLTPGSIYELAVVVANTILWASIVASIEQTIHQNHQQEALGDWTFGQTLAICAAIYGAIQAMSDWKSHWPDIKKSKNKELIRVLTVLTAVSPKWISDGS